MKNIRALEIGSVLWVYGGLLVICPLLDYFFRSEPLWAWTHSKDIGPSGFMLGFGFFALYALISFLLGGVFKWASDIERLFRQILTPISYLQILILGFLSGFAEEWFFRGVLLNHFGLVFSSLIFGIAHFLPAPRMWAWSIICVFTGYLLGMLYMKSQSLILVSLVHSAVNILILWRLNRITQYRPAIS